MEEPATTSCDLSTTCGMCGEEMRPEHAHYRCPSCGWRDSCCDGPY
ncbi:MAG: hypothetical protein WAT66_12020 [Actinomycetota bacterium]